MFLSQVKQNTYNLNLYNLLIILHELQPLNKCWPLSKGKSIAKLNSYIYHSGDHIFPEALKLSDYVRNHHCTIENLT